ncbi:MAG: phosphotransferase [Bacteroidales bacterium]|nr:phosphotransferase [Bacteroidales bacterium]
MAKNTEILEALFQRHFGKKADKIDKMPESGSNREYYYMACLAEDGCECVGTIGKEFKENLAFISFSKSFLSQNLPVPEVLEISDDSLAYLQTYIKGVSLFEYLESHRQGDYSPDSKTVEYYKKVLEFLPKFQVKCSNSLDYSKCYPRKKFDAQSIMWDLNYFKYYFLKTTHTVFEEQSLERDFLTLTNNITAVGSDYFMYRDFQSRNIIIREDGQPYFIDFQGGRKGPLQYDVASLLFDAKACLSPELRDELLDFYISELKKYTEVDETQFKKAFYSVVLIRILQALGSYGYRGFLEQKPHFLTSIPPALQNIRYLIETEKLNIKIPHIKKCLNSLIENQELLSGNSEKTVLTVTVQSFSYRRGIPYDSSGNGGGFVFDCRAIHNPGRYEKYKTLTGKSPEVIEFFSHEPQMAEFVDLTQKTVALSVKKYIQRGYSNLSVSFGCTGGQHRSVYCAEKTAEFLKEKFPEINVVLKHLEQEK